MQRLWSPWRSQYVSEEPESRECIFCEFPRDRDDERNLVLYRGERTYAIMNRFPYNSGHLMVVPYEHTGDLTEVAPETLAEMMALVQRSVAALGRAFRPDGYNTGMNLGRAAGAGVADHLHIHVVPRWVGDVNFMPVTADVKVMPELLADSYRKLRPYFDGSLPDERGG